MNSDPTPENRPTLKINAPCSRCRKPAVCMMPDPQHPKSEIPYCTACDYQQCPTCLEWGTIESRGHGHCFCRKRTWCEKCEEKNAVREVTNCPRCPYYHYLVCSEPCRKAFLEYLSTKVDTCAFCEETTLCSHTIFYTGLELPEEYRSAVFCMYAGKDASNEQKEWLCKKWICSGCRYKSHLVPYGWLCKEHYNEVYITAAYLNVEIHPLQQRPPL